MIWKIIKRLLLFVVAVLSVAGIYLTWFFELGVYRTQIEHKLYEATGQKWQVSNNIEHDMLPFPKLVVDQVRNEMNGEQPEIVVERLGLSLAWSDLWDKNWFAVKVHAKKVIIHLPEKSGAGVVELKLPHFAMVLPILAQVVVETLEINSGSQHWVLEPHSHWNGQELSGTVKLIEPYKVLFEYKARSGLSGLLTVNGQLLKPYAADITLKTTKDGFIAKWVSNNESIVASGHVDCNVMLRCNGQEQLQLSQEIMEKIPVSENVPLASNLVNKWSGGPLRFRGDLTVDGKHWAKWDFQDASGLDVRFDYLDLSRLTNSDSSSDQKADFNALWSDLSDVGFEVRVSSDKVLMKGHELKGAEWHWQP